MKSNATINWTRVCSAVGGFLLGVAAILFVNGCSPSKKPEGFCLHPAVNGGMPFALPETYFLSSNGMMIVTTKTDDGKRVTTSLTGAVCVFQTVK